MPGAGVLPADPFAGGVGADQTAAGPADQLALDQTNPLAAGPNQVSALFGDQSEDSPGGAGDPFSDSESDEGTVKFYLPGPTPAPLPSQNVRLAPTAGS